MLVIDKAKALILKLKDPARVLSVIPTAKKITVQGQELVAVPHKQDEVKVLRNLGFKAPAPILHYYNWPGPYTPFEHQRLTSAFLTMYKRGIVLNEIGCVDADTEYLSPAGWRRIADYQGGAVAQYHPEHGSISYVDNPEYVRLPCKDMIRFKTEYGVDQLLSPEHRVLYVGSTGGTHVTSAANVLHKHKANVTGWGGRIITTFTTDGGEGIPLTDAQIRLQVAVMADGHFPVSGVGTRCVVRIKKPRKIERLRKLLSEAKVSYTETQPEHKSARGFSVFRFDAPIREKSFGPTWWKADRQQLYTICDEVPYWDGSVRKAGAVQFFTSERESADFIQYAYSATGKTARLTTHQREGAKPEHVIHVRSKAALLYVTGVSPDGKRTDTVYEESSTDGFKYCFMVPSTFLILRRNGCVFATGNTGKTMSALWAADYLMKRGEVRKVLILSPLSTLERVWNDGVFLNFPHRKSVVLHGSAERRLRLLKTQADFYIVNHDGFKIVAPHLSDFDLVIVDEATVFRNPSTQRFKSFNKWLEKHPDVRLWLMTGTPTPNEPTDAWALAKLVESPYIPKTYTAFREMVMTKVGQYKYVPRHDAAETVTNVLYPAVRHTRQDCLDLPPTLYQTRQVPLTADQRTHYDTMWKHLITEVQQEGAITAANEAVKIQKLVQISCGVAYGDDGRNIEIDCAPRVDAVREVITEVGGKVIVFVPLTGTLHMLERELSKDWTVAVVNGEVPASKRNQIFHDFQNSPHPQVLIAHPATMAHGLTLTAASTVVWYGPINSNETYVQANGRIERIGKQHTSLVVHIEATPLEAKMYKRLENKQSLQGLLLDMIQQEQEKHQ